MTDEEFGRILQCLEQNAEDHKELKDILKEVADKKVDRDIYDIYLKSETRRISDIESKTDRAWRELVNVQNDMKWIKGFKGQMNTVAYASFGTIMAIFAVIGYAVYYLIEPIIHRK